MTLSDSIREKNPDYEDIDAMCDWLDEIDEIVQEKTGYSLSELPDQNYFDWFEEDCDADTTAAHFIQDWQADGFAL